MKTPQPYAEALAMAEQIVTYLAPACARIALAGSLRRRKPEVGDIELVAIPRYEIEYDLFGAEVGRHSLVDEALYAHGMNYLLKNGARYKQVRWAPDGISVDLYLVTAETWGVQYVLRTGCAEFSHWLVTPQAKGGALPAKMCLRDGRMWRDVLRNPAALETPEEADVFRAIGLAWIPPEARTAGRWTPKT